MSRFGETLVWVLLVSAAGAVGGEGGADAAPGCKAGDWVEWDLALEADAQLPAWLLDPAVMSPGARTADDPAKAGGEAREAPAPSAPDTKGESVADKDSAKREKAAEPRGAPDLTPGTMRCRLRVLQVRGGNVDLALQVPAASGVTEARCAGVDLRQLPGAAAPADITGLETKAIRIRLGAETYAAIQEQWPVPGAGPQIRAERWLCEAIPFRLARLRSRGLTLQVVAFGSGEPPEFPAHGKPVEEAVAVEADGEKAGKKE